MDTAISAIKEECARHGVTVLAKKEEPYKSNGVDKFKRVVLACDHAGKYRGAKNGPAAGATGAAPTLQHRQTITKKCNCSFRIVVNAQKQHQGVS
jgi:hypothetical protein